MSKIHSVVFLLLTFFSHCLGEVWAQSLASTSSLNSVFLAGRVASRARPDGIRSEAFIDSASGLTVCNGDIYFNDRYGFRKANTATGLVVTLISSFAGPAITCDGTYLYSTSSILGLLAVNRYEIATGRTTSFSYPQIDSFNRGLGEYSVLANGFLYTGDSASGRIWQVDLSTTDRSMIFDFGGPLIRPRPPISYGGPPDHVVSVGPFWVNGLNLYVLRDGVLYRVDINTRTGTALMNWPSNWFWLWGELQSAYFRDGTVIRKLDVNTGEVTTAFDGMGVRALWADAQFFYFTEPDDVGTIDRQTGRITTVAGESPRRADGFGSEVRFANTITRYTPIAGDSKSLYIADSGYIRVFDKATGRLSTVAGAGPFNAIGGMWTNGSILLVSDRPCIRKIDLRTHEVTTLAGVPGQSWGGFADGVGADARIDAALEIWSDGRDAYFNDNYGALRKVELATGRVTTLMAGKQYGGETFHSFYGMWGVGRDLYYGDERAIWKMNLDSGQISRISQTADFRLSGFWGDGKYLYISDSINSIRRLDTESGDSTTIYTSPDVISEGISGDLSGLYVVEAFSLRRLEPTSLMRSFGMTIDGITVLDVPPASSRNIVQAQVRLAPQTPPTSVTAIWSYRNLQGVLVSETSVAGQAPIRAGRIYAEVNGPLNTGIAFSNPNDADVRVDFHFTDSAGVSFGAGSFVLAAHTELAHFLNEKPFNGSSSIQGSFSFSASMPVVAVALRGLTNERADFLMTTLPVVDLDSPLRRDPITLAHYAAGGGWRTQVLLVNASEEVSSGTIHFFDESGREQRQVPYQLAPAGGTAVAFGNDSSDVLMGAVEVEPSGGSAAPAPLAVFSYAPEGITITESGTASAETPPLQGIQARSYVEIGGSSDSDPVNSAIAIANPTGGTIEMFIRLTSQSGDNIGFYPLTLPPHGHISRFVSELFPVIDTPFTGVLHVVANEKGSPATPAPVTLTGLRGRYNSRNEFIVATVMPVVNTGRGTTVFYLPHLVTGGGYTTRIFVVNTAYGLAAGDVRFWSADGVPVQIGGQ